MPSPNPNKGAKPVFIIAIVLISVLGFFYFGSGPDNMAASLPAISGNAELLGVIDLTEARQFADVRRGQIEKEANIKIDINTATAGELENITGVGPAIAKKIIEYRANKPFDKIEDIKHISGIGEKTFAKMKDEITVGGILDLDFSEE